MELPTSTTVAGSVKTPPSRCPLCDSNDVRLHLPNAVSIYSDKTRDLLECLNCRLIFNHPFPTPQEIAEVYQHAYAYGAHLLVQDEKQTRSARYATLLMNSNPGKRILEFGCSHGYFLRILKDRGYTVQGVELNEEASRYAAGAGIEIARSSVEDYLSTSREQFDAVVMIHVLEHIDDLRKMISRIRDLLSDQGLLYLIVPNADALTRKVFKRFWGYYQVPVHLYHFNRTSLQCFLEKNGFAFQSASTVGAESLFFLSTFSNLLGLKAANVKIGRLKALVISVFSRLMRWWYFVGNDDLVVVFRKTGKEGERNESHV